MGPKLTATALPRSPAAAEVRLATRAERTTWRKVRYAKTLPLLLRKEGAVSCAPLLKTLGHDPAQHQAMRTVDRDGRSGLKVYSLKTGKPVRWYSPKELRRLRADAAFCQAVEDTKAAMVEQVMDKGTQP